MRIIVTGGAGFIGSAACRYLVNEKYHDVLNIDKLGYASSLQSLDCLKDNEHYQFEKIDTCETGRLTKLVADFRPDAVMHLAAESHVDRSISSPQVFATSNVVGTVSLLEAVLTYWQTLTPERQSSFRFHHISTDEVFGDLTPTGPKFTETTPYQPSSPYSASKAASDHFVRAWNRTYGLPIVLSNCSNNYGPYQFPEKLIPVCILKAISNQPIPVYGQGTNIRDWLHVDDHVRGLYSVLTQGRVGESYNLGGDAEKTNLDVVNGICAILDRVHPRSDKVNYASQISFVADRPGHDLRYAVCTDKSRNELGWTAEYSFETGLEATVIWYLKNKNWWSSVN